MEINDRSRVREMFKNLRKRGFFARMNYKCCQSCAGAAAAQATEGKEDKYKGVIFYHQQDADVFRGDDTQSIEGRLYIAFGSVGDDEAPGREDVPVGQAIVEEAEKVGLIPIWNGSPFTRVGIDGWKTFTRRTNDPKLTWLEDRLDEAGIAHRRQGRSFHAPIMQVRASKLKEAEAILDPVDDIPDDDPQFRLAIKKEY